VVVARCSRLQLLDRPAYLMTCWVIAGPDDRSGLQVRERRAGAAV
jgi:hypothetical protein